MRKILLASTALVALTSVSAMAADVSISGSSEIVLDMGDSATTDQSDFVTEHDIAINFTNTSDSGITTSMSYGMDDKGNEADDLIVSISGDFGTISYTGTTDDHALTAVDNEASGTAEENTPAVSGTYTGALPGIGDKHMTYKLPTIVDGLGVAVSVANDATDGEAASYAITYAAGPLALVYGEVRDHAQTDTHVGVTIAMAGAKLMVAKNSNDEASHSNEATLIGATYAVSPELTLGLEMDKGETGTSGEDFSMTAFGATYAIAPGLSASITSAENDYGTDSNDSNYTSVGLHLSW
jgi:hypothetical protein